MTAQAQAKRSSDKLILKKSSSITPARQVELYRIAIKMRGCGLADTFIVAAVKTAISLEGAADLMHLWMKEKNLEEKNEIIADIQDLIDASSQKGIQEQYVKFNDLDSIAKDVRAFKDTLYQLVVARGGVSRLSELTGIPQPSLSRFFNSNAMPRRGTLLTIADALQIDGIEVDFRWSK